MTNIALIISIVIVLIGGILIVLAALDVKEVANRMERDVKKIHVLHHNMKSMMRNVTQIEDYICKNYYEECNRLRSNYIEEASLLETIFSEKNKSIDHNTQKIDDLYQKVYKLQLNQSKHTAQKAISEKYMLRRYGKRHRS